MLLNDVERAIRDGARGEAARRSLEQQIIVGDFFGAERFVEVSNVHMMGDYDAMGDAGNKYIESLIALGARVCVQTTRDAQCVDDDFAAELRQSPDLVAGEHKTRRLLAELGISLVDTCINYHSIYTPLLKEHVAWGDTGAVAYANAVLGARTNYEAGPAALAAGITGRTPAYGFHLDACRRANARCVIEADLRDIADWGAVGAVVGERVRGYWNVPLLDVRHGKPSPNDLKHLGASLASWGSMAMYHVLGLTPEAPTFEAANGGRPLIADFTVTQADIDAVFARGTPEDGNVNLVVFTAPQLSLAEMERIVQVAAGRKVHSGSTLIITTNAMNKVAAQLSGALAALEAMGAMVVQGTCWYVMDPLEMRKQLGWKRVVSNSAKLVNIIKAHGYEPVLRRTDDCVETAVTGRLP